MSRHSSIRPLVLAVVLSMAAAGCGGDNDSAGAPDSMVVTTSSTVSSGATTSTTSTSTPGEVSLDGASVEVLAFVDDTRSTRAEGSHPGAPDRTIETTVYLPSSSEPRPLIVLSHGHGGHPDKLRELSYHWSDAGFVVAVPKFPLSNHEVIDPSFGDVPEQAADVAFVVDSLQALDAEGGATAGRIDFEQIGLAGVSLGGITNWSTLMSGCCDDLEIDGMVVSDTAFPADPALVDEVTMPVLTIHSDVDPIFPYGDVRDVWEIMPAPRWLLTLHGALHARASENDDIPHSDAYQLASTEFWERVFGEESWDDEFPTELTTDGISTFEAT
ncbi:MAG: alpha/beta hydrolase family protein [Acidimicrobiales bacterium]